MSRLCRLITRRPFNWRKICTHYLDFWHKREADEQKAAIEYEMNKKWFAAKTPEKALERHLDVFGGYRWTRGTLWKSRAEDILKAIDISTGDTIQVSIDVAEWLSRYQEAQPQQKE